MLRKRLFRAAGMAAAMALACGLAAHPAAAQQNVLKIGVLGVMKGPAASWGLVNRYSAEATAEMYNEKGGIEIGGQKYRIQIVTIDDQLDPKLALAGTQHLIDDERIHYIIGPNIDTTAAVMVPLLRTGNAVNVAYGFARYLYTPPQRNSILGMVASYQDGPIIYRYLRDRRGVKSVSFVARNEADSLNQRDEGVNGARQVGLGVVSSTYVYEPGTTDFRPVMSKVLSGRDTGMPSAAGQIGGAASPSGGTPDLIVLSGIEPGDAPLAIKALRELGYRGLISTETAQDARLLAQAGAAADGFISVGGASPPETRSAYMDDFVRHYTRIAGEWDDEAGTKAYALEMILRTLQQAGPAAISDVGEFMKAIPSFAIDNPFLKEKSPLRYVGTRTFSQPRQIGVPLVVEEFRGGKFNPLFIGSAE